MAAPFPWTDGLDQQLRDLAAAGRSVRDIATEIGTTKSTIDRRLRALGITLDRSSTEAATKANTLDAKARRAKLQLALLEDAERLRAQAWQPTIAFNFGGKDNTYNEHQLDQPTFADQLKIMQATGIAIDRALKLDLHDAGGSTAVIGLLQQTAAALGIHDETDTQP
ncbi:helix-turn-helix domain-containing protein [Intrasporangium flavum]|uniref:helix-turn-helix domain-containing protein n=1 Tax=Intrasporangium flavum TaxID=1428657 RepID=UPI00096F0C39|nr:helix-turn-helix domain-containing protein [Intrasporangium flavum]